VRGAASEKAHISRLLNGNSSCSCLSIQSAILHHLVWPPGILQGAVCRRVTDMTVGCAKTSGTCPNAPLDIIADHKGANIAARNERKPSTSVIRPCLQKQISIPLIRRQQEVNRLRGCGAQGPCSATMQTRQAPSLGRNQAFYSAGQPYHPW
jgi:hypothetical protein